MERLIRTPDQRLRVFISSTLKELAEEREAVRQSVLKLRLVPVMFEAGARPHPARELYQAYLAQSHVFIGIYWQSYGWVGPGMEISGLEDEYVLSAGKPRLIYIKAPAPDREAGLERMLDRLQSENTTSYKRFTSTAELGELVENDLALLLTESYETASQASRAPAAEFAPRPLTNIPFPRNALLDREQEMKTICGWLTQEGTGLVTLTGAGGSGKSRLALEAAVELRGDFPDGAYLVRLSPLSDPRRVLPTIAETVGLRANAQSLPAEELLPEYLREKRMLLILDNFEQVLGAAPRVAELLEACPGLKALVTSRAPLHLRGEKELLVPPLAVPLPHEADTGRLSQYASVQLFIQRAQGIRPDFQVTNENAPAVAEICYRLDGLPLAIELAAARIKLLNPQELLARLGHRFDILRGGTRDLPERQQTLRSAIDWSYNLLSEPARALFRRLAVFAGGWSLEQAEAVCNLDGDLGDSVFEEIDSLVDFSMVFPAEGLENRQRFGMLESIREYALERLEESGETRRVRLAHAGYFLKFVREVEPHIRTAERVRWRGILEQDLENIRAALEWGLADPAGLQIGQEITILLAYYWPVGGSISEGHQLAERFLAQTNADTSMWIRAGLLVLHGGLALVYGRGIPAVPELNEAVEVARQAGDRWLLGTCLLWAGEGSLASRDPALAARQLQESLEVFHGTGNEWSELLGSLWLSNALQLLGEKERAADLFSRTLEESRRLGDPWSLVAPLSDVAQDAFARGELESARATLDEIISLCRIVGDNWTLAWALSGLAQIDLVEMDYEAVRRHTGEALKLARQHGNTIISVLAIVETAALVALRARDGTGETGRRQAEFRKAARLCGATRPLAEIPIILGRGIGTHWVYDFILAQVRGAVESSTWEQGVAEGVSIPFDEALELASQELREKSL